MANKINIRESLNRLDLQTDNKYDLRNTYDCSKISDDKKKKLAEALNENASAKTISRILNDNYKYNKSLNEKLNNREKNSLIKVIINAEEEELKNIIDDVYFYDRPLYLKLRHFTKKDSLNDKKDYLIKLLQDSLEESYGGYNYYLIEFFVDGRKYEEEYTDTSAKEALERFKEDYSDDNYKIREIYKLTNEGYAALGYYFNEFDESLSEDFSEVEIKAVNDWNNRKRRKYGYKYYPEKYHGNFDIYVNGYNLYYPEDIDYSDSLADTVAYLKSKIKSGEIESAIITDADIYYPHTDEHVELWRSDNRFGEENYGYNPNIIRFYKNAKYTEALDGEQSYKVVIKNGSNELNFESNLSYEDAQEIVDYYNGRWIDEKGYYWDMEIEEDDLEESLNESTDFSNKFLDIETNLRSDYYIRMKSGKEKVDTVYLQYEPSIDDYPHLVGYAHDDEGHYDWAYLDSSYIENLDVSPYMDSDGNIIDVNRMIEENPDYFYIKFDEGPISFDESLNEAYKFIDSKKLEKNYPYYFHYESNDPFAAEDFWKYAESLDCLKVEGKYKDSQNVIFFVCKSEDSYNKLLQFNEKNSLLPWIGELSNNYSNDYDQLIIKFFGKPKKLENLIENSDTKNDSDYKFTVELYTEKNKDPNRIRFNSYEEAFSFAKKKSNSGIYEVIMITKPGINGISVVNSFDINDGWFRESLKEDFEDEIDFEETDFNDGEVEEGNTFIEDGTEWCWIERIAGPIHLDFDNWAVWSARNWDQVQYAWHNIDIETRKEAMNNRDTDFFIEVINSVYDEAEVAYFVVDEDTGFIDWGPVETSTEAQDFLNSKVEDYENDEKYEEVEIEEESLHEKKEDSIRYFPKVIIKEASSFHEEGDWDILGKENSIYDVNIIAYDKHDRDGKRKTKSIEDNEKEFLRKYGYTTEKSARNSVRSLGDNFDIEIVKVNLDNLQESLTESRAIRNDGDYEVTLHYDDIGDGKEYDYTLGYDEVLSYLKELAWSNGDGPEDLNEDKYLEWVMDNFDELADKYELNVLDYFEDEASQDEYDHRYDEP